MPRKARACRSNTHKQKRHPSGQAQQNPWLWCLIRIDVRLRRYRHYLIYSMKSYRSKWLVIHCKICPKLSEYIPTVSATSRQCSIFFQQELTHLLDLDHLHFYLFLWAGIGLTQHFINQVMIHTSSFFCNRASTFFRFDSLTWWTIPI